MYIFFIKIHKHNRFVSIVFFVALFTALFVPTRVFAVPPPDIVVGIASSVVQIFSFIAVFIVGAFFSVARFVGELWRVRLLRFLTILILGAVIGIGVLYSANVWKARQVERTLHDIDKEYTAMSGNSKAPSQYNATIGSNTKVAVAHHSASDEAMIDDTTSGDYDRFVSFVSAHNDARFHLVEDFYHAIVNGDLDYAYTLFVPTVPQSVFQERFRSVERVVIYRLWSLSDIYIGGDIALCEQTLCVRYEVRMFLNIDAQGKVHNISAYTMYVRDSFDPNQHVVPDAGGTKPITNKALQKILETQSKDAYIVLDAREDAEYKNGTLPGSVHIRPADIRAGAWQTLPRDVPIYVMCWSGIRGRQVAMFLRRKGRMADYLEHGAKSWVDSGGMWEGGISFKKKYSAKRYSYVFSLAELKKEMAAGAIIIDTREVERFDAYHIPYSTNISFFETPRRDRALLLAQVPKGHRVITACDGYVNCFDARITGVALEEEGYTFIGRFAPVAAYKKVQ